MLHVINDLSVGGAEVMLLNLLSVADKRRFDQGVISLGRRSQLESRVEALSVPVENIDMVPGRLPTPSQMWRLLSSVRRFKPDLIQGWMYHGSLAAQFSRMSVARGARVLWSIHSCNDDLALEKRLTAAVIRTCGVLSPRPSKIIYVSHASRRRHESMGYCPDNACVIPNGFDTDHFAPSAKARETVRTELGVEQDHLLIGHVGRFHPMKDHQTFFRAAALLSKVYPAAHFLLIGREVNADNQVLRSLRADLALEGRVHLLGERLDVPTLLAAFDICSLSSSYGESFPLVVGEAMSCGVPCVVTDVGDAAKLVGSTGLVVPPQNPEALADAWRKLIAMGAGARTQLGIAARERVHENFLITSVHAQYEALFGSLNGGGG